MTKQEKLEDAINEGKEILSGLGIKVGNITEIKVNDRALTRFGQCAIVYRTSDWNLQKFRIEVSSRLLEENVKHESLMTVVLHELCHSAPDGMNHGGRWKHYAWIVNNSTPYHISRTTSSKELGIDDVYVKKAKYAIVCRDCGLASYYQQETKAIRRLINYPTYYRCSKCKTANLKVVDLSKESLQPMQLQLF